MRMRQPSSAGERWRSSTAGLSSSQIFQNGQSRSSDQSNFSHSQIDNTGTLPRGPGAAKTCRPQAMYATIGYIVPEYYKFPGYLSPSLGLKFSDVPNGLAALSKPSA